MENILQGPIQEIHKMMKIPFWEKGDFYIFVCLGIISISISWLAFIEARKAKLAAVEAGTTVKIQTITIELTEISQRLDKLDMKVSYSTARDLLNEISRKIRRMISPFDNDNYPQLKELLSSLKGALEGAKVALKNVKPVGDIEDSVGDSVYYAIEDYFSTINGYTSELIGRLERITLIKG
jgi:hypothetical protein